MFGQFASLECSSNEYQFTYLFEMYKTWSAGNSFIDAMQSGFSAPLVRVTRLGVKAEHAIVQQHPYFARVFFSATDVAHTDEINHPTPLPASRRIGPI
jgi:hypothetical protein